MLILTVNIDPSSPTMTPRLETMLDPTSIAVAGPLPQLLSACLAAEHGGPGGCTGGHTYVQVASNVTDSWHMSQLLLQVWL